MATDKRRYTRSVDDELLMDIKPIIIKNKQIFYFEKHHSALIPWNKLAKRINDILLITFDHHTDTIPPLFLVDEENNTNKIIECIKKNPSTMLSKLKNDQHIQTAIECGIINQALIIPHKASKDISEWKVPFSIEEKLWKKNWKRISDDLDLFLKFMSCNCFEDFENFFNQNISDTLLQKINIENEAKIYMPEINEDNRTFLEDSFLKKQFLELSRMLPKEVSFVNNELVITSKFILDIDLDYFHNFDVLKPKEFNIFKSLVSNAEIITIAKESTCVEMYRNDNSVTSELLLTKLLKLIDSVL